MKAKVFIYAGAAVLLAVGGYAYYEYRRLFNYTLKFQKIRIKEISPGNVSFDLYLWFTNLSDLKFVIEQQRYDLYVNGNYIADFKNYKSVSISPKGQSSLPLAVNFNPLKALKALIQEATDMIKDFKKTKITIDTKMMVRFWGFLISVPFKYETTIGELMQ